VLQRRATLTAMERQVLEVLATGALTDEVAHQLRISANQVRAHVRRSMDALGARSKLEAVLLALYAGVIQQPRA
jgi:DNA-binding CsgD family transcriptional regulator